MEQGMMAILAQPRPLTEVYVGCVIVKGGEVSTSVRKLLDQPLTVHGGHRKLTYTLTRDALTKAAVFRDGVDDLRVAFPRVGFAACLNGDDTASKFQVFWTEEEAEAWTELEARSRESIEMFLDRHSFLTRWCDELVGRNSVPMEPPSPTPPPNETDDVDAEVAALIADFHERESRYDVEAAWDPDGAATEAATARFIAAADAALEDEIPVSVDLSGMEEDAGDRDSELHCATMPYLPNAWGPSGAYDGPILDGVDLPSE